MLRVQFLVDNMQELKDLDNLRKSLQGENLSDIQFNFVEKYIYVTTSLSSHQVVKLLEKYGITAHVHGQSYALDKNSSTECGVGVFLTKDVEAIIRFVQIEKDKIFVDGSLIRLPSGKFTLSIHQYGDLTNPPAS